MITKASPGRPLPLTVLILLLAGAWGIASVASAQTSAPSTPGEIAPAPNSAASNVEQIRTRCIQERRIICGRVLQVLTNGLVVESGYADLVRPGLKGSWHWPATVIATRDPKLAEDQTPGAICVGQVFLTDLPRKRRAKIKVNQYDYVVITGYPAGKYTYTSVENLPHTVRCFACGLETAVRLNLESTSQPH